MINVLKKDDGYWVEFACEKTGNKAMVHMNNLMIGEPASIANLAILETLTEMYEDLQNDFANKASAAHAYSLWLVQGKPGVDFGAWLQAQHQQKKSRHRCGSDVIVCTHYADSMEKGGGNFCLYKGACPHKRDRT